MPAFSNFISADLVTGEYVSTKQRMFLKLIKKQEVNSLHHIKGALATILTTPVIIS